MVCDECLFTTLETRIRVRVFYRVYMKFRLVVRDYSRIYVHMHQLAVGRPRPRFRNCNIVPRWTTTKTTPNLTPPRNQEEHPRRDARRTFQKKLRLVARNLVIPAAIQRIPPTNWMTSRLLNSNLYERIKFSYYHRDGTYLRRSDNLFLLPVHVVCVT